MRQREVRIAERKDGFSQMVSERALISFDAMDASFAQLGIKPQFTTRMFLGPDISSTT